MLAAITALSLSIWIHISAAIVGFGATFAEAVTFPLAMQMDKRHLPYVHRLGAFINQRLTTPALAIVVVTGIYQTIDGDYSFGSFWISATFAIAIVLGGLLGAYFIPTDRKLAAMVEREIAAAGDGEVVLSADYQRQAQREGVVGTIAGVLIIVAVFLMVTKP